MIISVMNTWIDINEIGSSYFQQYFFDAVLIAYIFFFFHFEK